MESSIMEIMPDLFVIRVPLRGNPLKYVNSYVIKGKGEALVIDTGMNRDECYEVLVDAFRKLKLDSMQLNFFVTHLHADHIGLVARVAKKESRVYFSEVEADIVKSIMDDPVGYWREVIEFYVRNGFPEEDIRRIVRGHPGIRYTSWSEIEFEKVNDGDEIKVGDFNLRCISTPGHSPAHMCLLEEDRKLLFSGDHVLYDITPNITWWSVMEDSLAEYLRSLDKVSSFNVELVLPGHRSTFSDLNGRIRELKEHHEKRLDEILEVLKGGWMTAWDVAPHVSWDIEFSKWEDLPVMQRWFAVGETIAHLEYLHNLGKIDRRDGERVLYH